MPPARNAVNTPGDAFAVRPDPAQARTLDELAERLRSLKIWAGDPSYDSITSRVNAAWTAAGRPAGELARRGTVVDCFKPGRRRLNTDLVVAVVQALHPDIGYAAQWQQALQVIGGEMPAASQVRVLGRLPQDLAGFTGRARELDQLRQALHRGYRDGGPVVISAIQGMAGVGKTQLAIHAGHLLSREKRFDRVLFVNLRGFHPDPAQPPAHPAAVLDGFLRLLGVPGQEIPHGLDARVAAYRDRLAGSRTLVVLDNAADVDQIGPLLPQTPGCLTLVTSRRRLTELSPAAHLTVDVFTRDEAAEFLAGAVPHVPVGADRHAPARIAERCGYLPLALGLVTAHVRGTPGWTLTDHAERLDERHRNRRLDSGVELAFELSYQHLPDDRRRLLRSLALHPGQDLDAYAAAALSGLDSATARSHLHHLCGDHLLQQTAPDRYSLHDLIRTYAAVRAGDEDRTTERRAALTRLFDYYLAAAAAAMDALFPAEAQGRPRTDPPATATPALTDPDTAHAWLDTERPTLVAVAAFTAGNGWPTHTCRLSATLFRYLDGGHFTDAVTVHRHARQAAHQSGDLTEQARTMTNLGVARLRLGEYGPAAEEFRQALRLCRQNGDRVGQVRALTNLGIVEQRLGRYRLATDCFKRSLRLCRQNGDRVREARALNSLGIVEQRLGRYQPATDHFEQALRLFRQTGDRTGEAATLNNLGDVEARSGRYDSASDHLQQALNLYRQDGTRTGEAAALDSLGILHTRLGEPAQGTEYHEEALAVYREIGNRDGEAWALNGLGEAACVAGRAADALSYHTAAHTVAVGTGDRYQQARAHTGLGHACHVLNDQARGRQHHEHALAIYTELGLPPDDQLRTRLARER